MRLKFGLKPSIYHYNKKAKNTPRVPKIVFTQIKHFERAVEAVLEAQVLLRSLGDVELDEWERAGAEDVVVVAIYRVVEVGPAPQVITDVGVRNVPTTNKETKQLIFERSEKISSD